MARVARSAAKARPAPARSALARQARVCTESGGAGRAARQQRAIESSSASNVSQERIIDIQRARLLSGAAGAIEEYGYARTTVAHITTRARVSRRTFYEIFNDRDACLAALIEDVVALLEREIAAADLGALRWSERVRRGLFLILDFFDREPVLARVCVVEALRGGPGVLKRREAVLARLARALDEGRQESTRAAQCTELTAEGLVGATVAIVYARLSQRNREPLTGLLGDLMSLIVLPYRGAGAAQREQARVVQASHAPVSPGAVPSFTAERDPLAGIPMRLTYRTARVLECISEQPRISNRVVADQAGIADQGQMSKLLARLERLGLTVNRGEGHSKGEPNAWELTSLGSEVTRRLAYRNRAEERTQAA